MSKELLFLVLILVIGFWLVVIFNRVIKNRNRVEAAWSDIDVQLTRRYDLVPQLVAAVKQYASYEKATLEAVATLRQEAQGIVKREQKGEVESRLGAGLTRLIALAESYPDLKASENFLHLQKELVEVEDFLQNARRYYNGSVREFNTFAESFPNNLLVNLLRIHQYEFFEMDDSYKDRELPTYA
ncbi:MAG: LemA family protein [Gammaproteobacteria bacterium]|nr:LemA family protein [Gammaproteobacteria bacterium]NNC96852.1 LemA family protein [Gammaproteobacteria bacterium]NNM13021.1 LemA family protein [Gammaproteobacteria bacterium]